MPAPIFADGFDVMYKASPNYSDRNRIIEGYKRGMTPEEISMEVRVQLKSIKRYAPKAVSPKK